MTMPPRSRAFWDSALAAGVSLDGDRFLEAFAFGDSEALSAELAELVLAGRKRATAGLLASFESDGRRVPTAGDLSIVTAWDGTPLCIVETTQVDVVPFEAVDADFARREGEGEATLASWRRDHEAYFGRECQRIGRSFDRNALVVCEQFEVIHPVSRRT